MSDEFNASPRRGKQRFAPKEFRDWVLKVDGKVVPSQWFIDLSQGGLGIRLGQYGCYSVGDQIEIQLLLDNHIIIKGNATVQWRKPCDDSINMFELGLKVESYQHTDHLKDLPLSDLHPVVSDLDNPLPPEPPPRAGFMIQFMLVVLFPFLLGLILQLPL